jgi:CBS domain containing-hemolysin-like protein
MSQLLALILLVFLSGFFSGSETALVSVNRIRLKKLAEEGKAEAAMVEKLLDQPNKLLATILVGNNLVNIAAASIATSMAISYFGSRGVGIATGIMTFLILVFGEVTPKSYAIQNAEKISLRIVRPMNFLVSVLYPLVRLLIALTKPVITRLSGEMHLTPYITEEEIKMLVEVGEREGVIEKGEKEMIHGVFKFGDMEAKEVMVPRIDMECLNINDTLQKAIDNVINTGHSRFPVYEKNIDNIVGVLNSKDLFGKPLEESIRDLVRPAYYIPESKKLDEILREMQERKTQIAIVVDEYGGTLGLVTLEDILEEIVGEIMDEYDIEEPEVQIVDEGVAIVDAKADIEDLNEALGIDLPAEDFETVGGLIFNVLGRIPKPGDQVKINGNTMVVETMRGRRIAKIRVIKSKEPQEGEQLG